MNLTELLEPIAQFFRSLNLPEPITHWGHPAMMGVVIFVMGTFVGITGWKGRLVQDQGVALENKSNHRKLAPWMFTFMALGYTGGVLSLVMQEKPILESPHFLTGTVVLGLLAVNGLISLTGFGGDNKQLRTAHAILGSIALAIMVIHALLGLQLGLAI
ncbi:hypothetical protein PCC7418_0852 [Halothece sp. PCC 7418]|uniref:DUF4079 domain-containing protein n=1 Tax=Halothece sp. (strain PCC 7418) TaxID=65093 RepID=UPI0002A05E47|nr:DUF4079 domain-containing protein [Halothece sp. PCC 7418]AFZ43067.1 hypothetical protein PCC7418_0852 [Halothece sp. PCC 7418]